MKAVSALGLYPDCYVRDEVEPIPPPLFPTRRSSDLTPRPPSRCARWCPRSARPTSARWAWRCTATPARAAPAPCSRSEEHTSELQSRPHLVCRLLLEKKKKIQLAGCQS